MPDSYERLQTVLSRRGVASRRGAADIISQGRVTVNGQTTTEPGLRVDPVADHICVDTHPLAAQRETIRTIMLNKPPGCTTTLSEGQGPNVMQFVRDIPERVVPVGRLDKESEGLLLLSNDGELINQLTHPSHGHIKRYEVKVRGRINSESIDLLRAPIHIEGADTRPADVRPIRPTQDGAVLEFILGEGRNRQIRRLCRRANLQVLRLRRTSIGRLTLSRLAHGEWRDLTPNDLRLAKS